MVDPDFLQAYAINVPFMVCLFYGTGGQAQNFLHAGKALYHWAAAQLVLELCEEASCQTRTLTLRVWGNCDPLGSQSVKAIIKHHSLGGLNNTDHFFLFLGSRGLKTKIKMPAGLVAARAVA